MDEKECHSVELKGRVDLGKAKEVKIKSSQRRPIVVWQTDDIEDIVAYVWKRGNPVFPTQDLDQIEDNERLLRERIKERAEGKFAYVTRSLCVSANVGLKHSYSEDVDFYVFLSEQNTPVVVFSVLKDDNVTDASKSHISCVVKEIVALIRKFTDERFSAVFGLLLPKDLKSKAIFSDAVSRIIQETGKLSTPESLAMTPSKQSKVVRALISGMALTKSVWADGPPSLWFLTFQQFQALTENIDCKEVNIITDTSSGGKTLSLEVLKRLEQSEPSLLISSDEDVFYRARKLQLANAVKTPDDIKTMEQLPSSIKNIITDSDPDLIPVLRRTFPCIKHLWKFSKKKDLSVDERRASIQTDVVPAIPTDVSKATDTMLKSMAGPSVLNISEVQKDSGLQRKRVFSHSEQHFTVDVARVRIYERTVQELEEVCRYATRNVSLQLTLDRLEQRGIVILIGSPGDGKTTIGYQVLEELMEKGFTPLRIKSPDEYFNAVTFTREAVLIESIFGINSYDKVMYQRWLPVFTDVQQQIQCEQKKTYFVITSRDYIFHESVKNNGSVSSLLSMCNISVESPLDFEEKKNMILSQSKGFGICLQDNHIYSVCDAEIPFGFPFSCHEFFQTKKAPEMFAPHMMNHPSFLMSVIQMLFADYPKNQLFCELVKHKGKMDLKEVQHKPSIRQQTDILTGFVLVRNDNVVRFIHRTVHVAVATVLFQSIDPELCIKTAKLSVLDDIVNMKQQSSFSDKITVRNDLIPVLTNRLLESIQSGKVFQSLSMQLFCNPTFVTEFLEISDIPSLLKRHDKKKQLPFTHFISANGGVALLKNLLGTAHKDIRYKDLVQILRGCCEFGNVAAMKIILSRYHILESGTPMSIWYDVDQDGNLPIHVCALHGNMECLRELLKATEEKLLNRTNRQGKTALHLAVENKHCDISIFLMEHIDCEIQDNGGQSALHIACQNRMHKIVTCLVKKTKSPLLCDRQGNTALHDAASTGDLKTISEMLTVAKKGDVNTGNKVGRTPLQMLPPQAEDCYDLLLENGADPLIVDELGYTTLHCYANHKGSCHIIGKLLRKQDLLKNSTNKSGQTPLHLAALVGDAETVQLLLDTGADPLVTDRSGFIALHYACGQGYLPVVALLSKSAGFADESGVSALHESASNGHTEIVEYLLDRGCDVDLQNMEGWTALHTATDKGHLKVVQALIQRGCQVNATTREKKLNFPPGVTSLHIAASGNHANIVEELLNHGIDVHLKDKCKHLAKNYAKSGEMFSRLNSQEEMSLYFKFDKQA